MIVDRFLFSLLRTRIELIYAMWHTFLFGASLLYYQAKTDVAHILVALMTFFLFFVAILFDAIHPLFKTKGALLTTALCVYLSLKIILSHTFGPDFKPTPLCTFRYCFGETTNTNTH
jgi:hypothetical protein